MRGLGGDWETWEGIGMAWEGLGVGWEVRQAWESWEAWEAWGGIGMA